MCARLLILLLFFFCKKRTAYEIYYGLVGSERCIRDRSKFAVQSVNNPTVNLTVSIVALVANVLALGYIMYRAKKQHVNPWLQEVFKGTRDEWAEVDTIRAGAMNVPFNFLDPGPDGLTGTADDQTVALVGLPAGTAANRVYGNPEAYGLPGYEADYHTVEFAVNRRLKAKCMLLSSFAHTWANSFANPGQASTSALGIIRHATAYRWNPNQRRFGRQDQTFWNFKVVGRYELPWQLAVAGSYKLQSGANWARSTRVPIPGLGNTTVAMEPRTANRSPNVGILDLRAEKAFKFMGSRRFTAMVDVFNALNADTVTNFRLTSPAANTPLTVNNRYKELIALLDPRIVRFGVRLDF